VSTDGALVAELHQELAPLYDNARARRFLGNSLPATDDMRDIIAAAEDVALGLLIDDVKGVADEVGG
jgi:hypothetical protein